MKTRKNILLVIAVFLLGTSFTGCYWHEERRGYRHPRHQGPPPPSHGRY